MNTGIHTVPADTYHADQIDDTRPSLSASIATVLCTQSPAHARAKHPRLNPDFKRTEEQKFDVGTAAHALFLEGRDAVHVVAALDWRTADAKHERDYAREMGKVPLLNAQWAEVQAMVASTHAQLQAIDATPRMFWGGSPERTVVWDELGVLCRARFDWLHADGSAVDDFKTTSRSANPESWSRTLFSIGADVQAAFYLRGLRSVSGVHDPVFRWCVQETFPPYALSVVTLAPGAMALAEAKVDHALKVWKECVATDTWPAYPTKVAYAEAPPWEMTRWLERDGEVAA